jgi:hypothetical protein
MAANWHVIRIEAQQEGTTSLLCGTDEHAAKFTMKDSTTGETRTIVMCVANHSANPCDTLDALAAAGFTPNDWGDECLG